MNHELVHIVACDKTSFRERFPGEVLVDLLCNLRIHLEPAIRAKADLMKREAGFAVAPDASIEEK